MFCVHCGAEIPDGAQFCPECGKAAEANNKPESLGESLKAYNASGSSKSVAKEVKSKRKRSRKKAKKPLSKKWIIVAVIAVLLVFPALFGGNKQSEANNNQAVEEESPTATAQEKSLPASSESEDSDLDSKRIDTDSNPTLTEKTEESVTPLSDFWISLDEGSHTITLNAFETHDKKCIIPSEYIIDGERWPVTRIGDACFFGRTSLEYLVIPEGVTSIEHNAFNSCTVKEIFFPSSLQNIDGIFEYLDSSKRTIYYAGNSDSWWAIQGADQITDNIDLIGDTPVPTFVDETDYAVASLTTEKSQAEQLGGSAANALNGLFQGLNEGLSGEERENNE